MILKSKRNLNKISKGGKFFFLAYDQGLEHGPTDFNDSNVNPLEIIRIAKEGKFTGVIFQKGIAEQYYKEIKKSKVPLILKLNGKTSLVKDEPISKQLCTVEEAIDLGAKAVGYTIFLGSVYEKEMFSEFESIQREAHEAGLPVIAWMYPRGKSIEGKSEKELLAYAARVGLELGADIVKLHWSGKVKEEIGWAVKSAGKVSVVIAGGSKTSEEDLKNEIKAALSVGVSGLAIGRNIWQSKDPIKTAEELRKIVFEK